MHIENLRFSRTEIYKEKKKIIIIYIRDLSRGYIGKYSDLKNVAVVIVR